MRERRHRFRVVAESVFPKGARVFAPPGEGPFVLLVSWKLATDPAHPNKRSRTIRIAISEEAMELYLRAPPEQRDVAASRFKSLLEDKLAGFDPSHNAPLGTEPPVDKWAVSSVQLHG